MLIRLHAVLVSEIFYSSSDTDIIDFTRISAKNDYFEICIHKSVYMLKGLVNQTNNRSLRFPLETDLFH